LTELAARLVSRPLSHVELHPHPDTIPTWSPAAIQLIYLIAAQHGKVVKEQGSTLHLGISEIYALPVSADKADPPKMPCFAIT
jgi:hypothetical protein